MPVFEEKWVSPLAIRFTQNHIRTTFRDGSPVEPTVSEIQARPAPVGSDYDVVLHAPFPNVEIVRWRTEGEEQGSHSAQEPGTTTSHWFTLDNRRLYCLQRVAASLWPKRVAAVVEILYTDLGRMRRKFDSTTFGWAVSIAHSSREEELSKWDWRLNVPGLRARPLESLIRRAKAGSAEYLVLDTILDDDEKQTTEELSSAPEERGMLAAFFAQEDAAKLAPLPAAPAAPQQVWKPTCKEAVSATHSIASTSASTVDSDSDQGEACKSQAPATHKLLKKQLDNSSWHGIHGEVYTLLPRGDACWAVVRTDAGKVNSTKKFTLTYDEHTHSIWWGIRGMYYVDARSFSKQPDTLGWYGWSDRQYWPRFTWTRSETPHGSRK